MSCEIFAKLRAPFAFEEIEAKIQVTTGDKNKGMAVFYLDARAVQERLDTVLGPFGWRNEYIRWQDKSQICGLSIYCAERSEWITKYDGAENSDIEAVKGGLTDAFKRSAVLWGVGRYLYQIDGVWVEVEQRGKGSYIKDNQQARLKNEYEKAVARIFGVGANTNRQPKAGQQVQQPVNSNGSAGNTAPQQPTAPPASQNTAGSQQPPVPQVQTDEQKHLSVVPSAYDYKVHSVKPSGKSSQLLELSDNMGEILSAYIKSGDSGIAAGSYLRDVQIEEKTSSYGKYNLIASYELAAA